jgi:hypothetical protein
MSIGVCSNLNAIVIQVAKKLLPEGIILVCKDRLDQLTNLVEQECKMIIVDDMSIDKKELILWTAKIKKDPLKSKTRFILLSGINDLSTYTLYQKVGFDLVIYYKNHINTIIDKVKDFVETHYYSNDQRRFVRVKPDNTDRLYLQYLSHYQNDYVKAAITDISMGGVAAKFEHLQLDNVHGGELQNVQLMVNNKSIFTDLKLIKKADINAAFSFMRLKETSRDLLSEYIFNRLNGL